MVDDDGDVCFMLETALHRMGYLVAARTNPIDALALFSDAPERFDAVIIDQMMPELKGTQLARQLLQIKDDIPVILVTAMATKSLSTKCDKAAYGPPSSNLCYATSSGSPWKDY
jgi:CheY-like chemotaxis protein